VIRLWIGFCFHTGIVVYVGFLAGCEVWEANRRPDYGSSRAELVCHPYGECSQGQWIAIVPERTPYPDSSTAYQECVEKIDQMTEVFWWEESVARGIEIGRCMRQLGFRLSP
jgi:hypothetical protein